MKRRMQKWMVVLMTVLLVTSILPVKGVTSYAATKPSLSLTSKTLIGVGAVFNLSVKNLDSTKVKSTAWSSQNKNVATVDAVKGIVTSTGKGTTTIKCKITYKDKSVVQLSCKVTVKIQATAIDITNTPENGNYFVMTVGDTIDFNSTLTPSNASDLITYSIDNTAYATVDKKGIVTALKAGVINLTATASLTKAGAATSYVKDIVNIQIVDKKAGVKSAVLTDNTTLTITFDNAINESTVLDDDKNLENITVTPMKDTDDITAASLGDLTGVLSSDGKTLTITSENAFSGLYSLHLTNSITTTDGIAISEYYSNLKLYDTKAPYFKDYEVDDTGLIVTLEFSEPMDFSKMAISKVSLVKSSQTAEASTLSLLKTKTNYVKSEDNKSLTIDLTTMDSDDQNKTFAVVFSGLKDSAGNYPANANITAYVATDTTEKAQAKLSSLTRTGYYTVTAKFTRSIKVPGEILLSDGTRIEGVVDEKDKTKVNYTLDADSAKLTGSQKVSIGYWDSYNVKSSDNTADKYTSKTINFTVDTSAPVLKSYKLTTETEDDEISYILTLTYDKDVTLTNKTGKFTSKLVTLDNDIYSNKLLSYTATTDAKVATVVLNKEQFDENGTYTITIPAEFVKDGFYNASKELKITVKRTGTSGTALPAPVSIEQSSENPSLVLINFDNKLDETTAELESNYTILGTTVTNAELVDNNSTGATVQLTLKDASISVTATYPITIKGIKGYQNSYTEMNEYESTVLLNENVGPSLTKVKYSYPGTIELTFDEDIEGTASFQVVQNGKDYADDFVISGNTVIITLNDVPTMKVQMKITPTSTNSIKDESGNKANISTKYITPNS